MANQTSTINELESRLDASCPRDSMSSEARAWFRRQLRWERRLAELRTQAERARGAPTATRDPRPAAGLRP